MSQDFEYLDEDEYPTEEALLKIQTWDWRDMKGVFDFMKSLWYYDDYFTECRDRNNNKTVYMISTIGWSGNESLIEALEKNYMIWSTTWVSSRRGGHYIFELKDKQND